MLFQKFFKELYKMGKLYQCWVGVCLGVLKTNKNSHENDEVFLVSGLVLKKNYSLLK